MSYEEDEETFEHTLLVVREVSVFKIPPRSTSGGYKCGEWLQSDKIWTGRLRVVSCKVRCEIHLENPNSGELFAACFVNPGQRESSVEPVLDSSRYFVLKIEDGQGKHAFIGLGFNERNEAFDFNVALSDHEKYVKRVGDKDAGVNGSGEGGNEENLIDIHPAVNHRLKEGETIRINVKNKVSSGAGMLSAVGLSSGLSGTGKAKTLGLAPPPSGGGKIRSPLPPPPNDPAAARINSPGEGETIRINVKNKVSSGAGMLSAVGLSSGLSGTGKSKTHGLAPPPSGGGKIRSPLPPPPNDPAAARINSPGRDTALKGFKETGKQSNDPLSDLSQLERNLPAGAGVGSGSAKTSAAGWAAFW